ncbi:hypothetical protein ACP70R_014994 [Stipagrostis hirtigluma subsp. patula]
MEVDVGGGEPAASAIPGRGTKRPASPTTIPSDGEDSVMSTTSDDSWVVSDSDTEVEEDKEEEDEEEENQGMCHPFTVEDFPRLSSDYFEQTDTLYRIPNIRLRGPPPLSLFRAFKDPVSIKKGSHLFGRRYRLYDESELSVNNAGTTDCSNHCSCKPAELLQFVDLKISGYHHGQPGHAKIFGFFAARDQAEPLRNYVYRHEIDDYEAVSVKQKMGMARLSLTSPARGICITSHVLLEFKLCIRSDDPPEDDPKGDTLIEGCTEFSNLLKSDSFVQTGRLYGERCGLDLKFLVLINAVQATVYVEVLRAPTCGLNLKLYAKTSGFSDVIRLFQGVAEIGHRFSSVVAVMRHSHLDLCIKGSSIDKGLSQLSCAEWKGSFDSCYHGTADKSVNLDDFTTISVKVTWKAVDWRQPLNR